jgi:hypothetical protein
MDGDRKRDGIDTIAKFYRHAAIIRNFFSVADPSSFDTDPDPAFWAEYRSGSGSNPDPGVLMT